MPLAHKISQRDLRMRSKEIMDAVERGASFAVTRDGREIGDLVPLRRARTFVPADEFLARGRGLGTVDPVRFRRELDDVIDTSVTDPYGR